MKNLTRLTVAATLMAAKMILPGGAAMAASTSLQMGAEGGIGWGQDGNNIKDGWTDEGSRSGGVMMDYGSQAFGIRPSILLTQRDETYAISKYKQNGDGTESLTSRINDAHHLTQLEIPLLLRLDLPGEAVRPMFLLGPRLMMTLSDQNSGGVKGDWCGNNNPLGLTAGMGLDVPFDHDKEAAQVQLRYDLNGDQMQNGNSGEVKLMVGFGFNIWHHAAIPAAAAMGQGMAERAASRRHGGTEMVSAYKDLRMIKAMAAEGLIDDQEYQAAHAKLTSKAFAPAAEDAAALSPAEEAGLSMPPDPAEANVLPSARIEEGRKLYKQGRYAEAEQYFRWLSEEKPADAEPLRYLGNCLWAEGKQQEAADVLSQAAKLSPDAPALGLWLKSKGF